jgi:hypothetical protein
VSRSRRLGYLDDVFPLKIGVRLEDLLEDQPLATKRTTLSTEMRRPRTLGWPSSFPASAVMRPNRTAGPPNMTSRTLRERATRIELALSAWEADVLPLNYARTPTRRPAEPPYQAWRPRVESPSAPRSSARRPGIERTA